MVYTPAVPQKIVFLVFPDNGAFCINGRRCWDFCLIVKSTLHCRTHGKDDDHDDGFSVESFARGM